MPETNTAQWSPYIAIAGMAVATYFTRILGVFIADRLRPSRRVEGFLTAVPGAVIISIVAPAVLTAGPAEAVAGLAAVVTAARSKSLLAGIGVGVGTVFILRRLLGP